MKKRILTGDTPTGKLHLGHYVGTLQNRVKLQDEYETFIILADLHALTTLSQDPYKISEYTLEVAIDNLAVGLDPKKSHIFVESLVPEIYELAALFSMYVTYGRAMRNPTIKDEIKMKGLGDTYSLGFINYPIYQAADILCVKANLVPVGKDQVAHLEQTREIARNINRIANKEIFPIPEVLVGQFGRLPGIDGKAKMSKSLGNAIYLSDSKEEVKKKVMRMYTDPTRIRATDPGHIEGNAVFTYHDIFNTNKDEVADMKQAYEHGKISDVAVKEKLFKVIENFLAPIRERRTQLEKDKAAIREIIITGSNKAQIEAQKTLEEVKEKMGLSVV